MEHNLISFCLQYILHRSQLHPDYNSACQRAFNHYMTQAQRDQLKQLVSEGPIWDGNVISKESRDDLIESGLASRACVKGEQGYTVANYRGYDVFNAQKIRPNKKSDN